jgi:hypothetical protein
MGTVKQADEIVLKNVVKATNGLRISLAIPYKAIRIMENTGLCDL